MNTHVDKTQENKSQPVAAEPSCIEGIGGSAFQFIDNRPEALVQRKLLELSNKSLRVSQLRALQKIMNNSGLHQGKTGPDGTDILQKKSEIHHTDPVQLNGRSYSKKFSSQKSRVKNWIEEQGLLGFSGKEVEDEEEIDESEEATSTFGWHHIYPFSDLYDNMDKHVLANHGKNLVLGPMANRIGDPGHEIDLNYLPGYTQDEEEGTYVPNVGNLSGVLRANRRERTRSIVPNPDALPDHDVPRSVLDTNYGTDKPFDDNVSDFSTQWSEWYLSASERNALLSDQKITEALAEMEVNAPAGPIISALNIALDKGLHDYVTHTSKTPVEEGGREYAFRENAVKELGIPSTFLNKTNFQTSIGGGKNQSDLLHYILSNKKWVNRGSKGDPISLEMRYKVLMQSGPDVFLTIQNTLAEADLSALKTLLTENYKETVEGKIKEQGLFGDNRAAIIDQIVADQSASAISLTNEQYKAIIKNIYGTPKAPENYDYIETVSTFAIKACPPIPQDEFSEQIINCLLTSYKLSQASNREKNKAKIAAAAALKKLCNDIYQYHIDNELPLYAMRNDEMDINISVPDVQTLITMKTDDEACDENFNDYPEELTPIATEIHTTLKDKIKEFDNSDSGLFEEASKGTETRSQENREMSLESLLNNLYGRLQSHGTFYGIHCQALSSGENQKKYANLILTLLRKPGEGFEDSNLEYDIPDTVTEAEEWPYTDNDERIGPLKKDWLENRFAPFLEPLITSEAYINYLSQYRPN